MNGQPNPIAGHKQDIRRVFHKQLKQLWAVQPFLNSYRRSPEGMAIEDRPVWMSEAWFGAGEAAKRPFSEVVADRFRENNYRFVPLVCDDYNVTCSIDILFLRRDPPGSAIQAGDIDNRVKTLIDALRKPAGATELRDHSAPGPGEDPFYCLLQDDKLIEHFSVETDTLLDEVVPGDADRRKAKVVVTVALKPYLPTFFSLAFS